MKKKVDNCFIGGILYAIVLISFYVYYTKVKVYSNISDFFSYVEEKHLDKENLIVDIDVSDHKPTVPKNVLHHDRWKEKKIVIAVGGSITSERLSKDQLKNIAKHMEMFTTFLPSFCLSVKTSYRPYSFQFYLAFDHDDTFLSQPGNLNNYHDVFVRIVTEMCPRDFDFGLHLVQCTHSKMPTWAQNDAMKEAYIDGVDYHYRIIDNTKFTTANWMNAFITTLKSFNPPLVGIVAPQHDAGNLTIWTHDFVHSSHINIFGFYYPKVFVEWRADNWITSVYDVVRSRKIKTVRLSHSRRYNDATNVNNKELKFKLERDRLTLKDYISTIKRFPAQSISNTRKSSKLVLMSMYGNDADIVWGVIRNAQQISVHLPGWRLRVYTPSVQTTNTTSSNFLDSDDRIVPQRVIDKLLSLDVDVQFVPLEWLKWIDVWPLAAFDDSQISHVLVRDPRFRFSKREASLISAWTKSPYALHCIRDHPMFADQPIPRDLWGVNLMKARRYFDGRSLFKLATEYLEDENFEAEWRFSKTKETVKLTRSTNFLDDVLYRVLQSDMMCHDIVSQCKNWRHKVLRVDLERFQEDYIGMKFDSNQDPVNDNPLEFPYQFYDDC